MTPLPGGMPPGSSMRRPPAAEVVAPLLATAATVAATAAVSAGAVLAARRLAGSFIAADPGLAWLTLGGGLILLGIADAGGRGAGHLARSIAARSGLLLGIAALTMPPRADDWISTLALVGTAAVCALPPPGLRWRVSRRSPRPESRRTPAPGRMPQPVPVQPSAASSPDASVATDSSAAVLAPEPPPVAGRLHQRLERYESAEGADCVAGHVRLSIPAGSRATHAHVGFCPAFTVTPSVEVSTDYDGVEAVVTAAEVLPWGVRIECRLSEPAEEPLDIPVDLVAKAPR